MTADGSAPLTHFVQNCSRSCERRPICAAAVVAPRTARQIFTAKQNQRRQRTGARQRPRSDYPAPGRNAVIPGAFAYHRPEIRARSRGPARRSRRRRAPLAGGHSLIPMMKLRLATPAHLVDLAGIADLKGIRADGGDIVIGAMTTQHEVIGSDLLAAKIPILRETVAADRRSAGALRRHARRQRRERRSRQRHAGGHDVPRRQLSGGRQGRRAPHRRHASSTRAPISPRSSRARS